MDSTAHRMSEVIGVDGCRAGWLSARLNRAGRIDLSLHAGVRDILRAHPAVELVLIDVPIGLVDGPPGTRACDALARRLLGRARSSTVFTPPSRAAVYCSEYRQACDVNERLTGKRLSRQTWGIVPKIREVDTLLQQHLELRSKLFEAHPEVLFRTLNGGEPMRHRKKTEDGVQERLSTLLRHVNGAAEAFDEAIDRWPRSQVARDDVLDALAAGVTARVRGASLASIPEQPEFDAVGIPMRMVY